MPKLKNSNAPYWVIFKHCDLVGVLLIVYFFQELYKEIKLLKNSKSTTEDDLEDRVEKLEEIAKYKTLRTCNELSNRGITSSGVYTIDPDGDGIGYEPILVFCNFQDGTTEVYHDHEDMIKVDKCDEIGCASYDFNYLAPPQQIDALINLSQSCYQDISFGCFMAPLQFEGMYNMIQ